MICSKCGAENSEDSVFCNKCATNLSGVIEQEHKPKWFSNRRNIILSCAILVIGILVVVGIISFNNPVSVFKSNINNNKYSEATKIYDEKIKGKTDKENSVNSFLKDDIANIQKSFSESKIDYNTAKTRLETISNTHLASSDVSSALDKINSLNNSRIAFNKAEGFLKNKDLVNAIKEYKNVIPDDQNYEKAKEQITNNVKQYKEQVLKNAEDSANAKDYAKSITLLKEAALLIPNDSDLAVKLSGYEKQLEEKLVAEQQVTVESAKIVVQDSTYKSLYPDMIQVILKNSSQKTIKNLNVGCLGYDKNGYPLKIKTQFSFSGADYEFVGNAPDVNIVAGGTFGGNNGWKLDESHGISKVLACVKSATFYDGTTWDNPYYDYWIDQYKEKPLN
ncbi:MAG: DUF5780 domain-containing protein [Desulfosporosinus sp.]|nr:DUF5780 domain-containing protein [Desulfosporosinus sp.]